MDSPIYVQWQQWESRIQEWLQQVVDDLELPDTDQFDRVILTILTVKYQVLYEDLDKEVASSEKKKHSQRKSTVKLSKIKAQDAKNVTERHGDKEKLFVNWTGRLLSPQQVINETSAEWQEFNQLHEWHGQAFLQRFEACLRQFVSELIGMTPAYQKFIHEPPLVSPATKIENEVYRTKNEGQIFLSVDVKSANFASLQYINAIDVHSYPTWSSFLTTFVGTRPVLVESKKLRLRCLGQLPEYYKLEALWTHYIGNAYRNILCPCLDEKDIAVRCMSLTGDEAVFHLDASLSEKEIMDLMEDMQTRLTKHSPIIKFHVHAYRLRLFHWRNKHVCIARMFIGQSDKKFDLKCVPHREQNYEQAFADFLELTTV